MPGRVDGERSNDDDLQRPNGPVVTPKLLLYAAALMILVVGVDVAAVLEASFALRLSLAIGGVVLALALAGLARRARGAG